MSKFGKRLHTKESRKLIGVVIFMYAQWFLFLLPHEIAIGPKLNYG
jgi:hypothetical protein